MPHLAMMGDHIGSRTGSRAPTSKAALKLVSHVPHAQFMFLSSYKSDTERDWRYRSQEGPCLHKVDPSSIPNITCGRMTTARSDRVQSQEQALTTTSVVQSSPHSQSKILGHITKIPNMKESTRSSIILREGRLVVCTNTAVFLPENYVVENLSQTKEWPIRIT